MFKRYQLLRWAPFASLAFVASPALGQGKATTIPPIEVVATRSPMDPGKVPASIEVISGDKLRASGARSIADALRLATGVSVAPGGDMGPASSVLEFWGLREFDAFLLVVDNVPWGGALNPAVSTASLRDVERIEILRGPAPVTYGATSFVGVVHIVHKSAAATSKSYTVNGGSFGSGSASAELGFSKFGDWSPRLTADVDHQKFKDDRTGFDRGHVLIRMAKGDADRSSWLSADVNILKQDPASPHPRDGKVLSADVPLDANYNPDKAHLDENRFAISAGMTRPVMGTASWGSTLSFTKSSQDIFRGFLTDISNSNNNAAGFKETIDVTDIYADTHILWPEKKHLSFMLGADALFANGEGKGATFTYTVPLSGATAANVTEPTTLDKDSENRRLFLGAYGSTSWTPIEHLTLSAGVRFNSTSERRGEEGDPSTSHTRFSGNVGALFGVYENGDNHVNVFANYRDTFKPAAFDFGLVENEGVLDPETSQSYEGGFKAKMMDGKMGFEASYFNMDFKNLVTATVINNQPALINSGKTRFKGFEVAAEYEVSENISARATYSKHDGKFVDFIQSFDGVPTQLGGKFMEMSAKNLWSAGVSWSPETGMFLNASANYVGERFLNKRNTAPAEAFTTFDAGIGYRTGRYEFRVDGRNLGDRRDPIAESEFGDAQYYRMPARSVQGGVSIRY